ncbi:hypothetical protein BDZ89DRAFT_1065251 [Hymenopellis radicata]|nr:hypothetical protein BDZ89DRAFT_1065251 [Hymenopellis radicata]
MYYPIYNSQHHGHFAPHQQQIFPAALPLGPNAGPSGGMNSFPLGPSGHSFPNEFMGVMQYQAMNADARPKLQPRPQYTPFGQLPQSQATFLQYPDQAIVSIPDDHSQQQSKPPGNCRQASGRKSRDSDASKKMFSRNQVLNDNFVTCDVNRPPPPPPPIASTSTYSVQLKRPRSPDPESEAGKAKKLKLSSPYARAAVHEALRDQDDSLEYEHFEAGTTNLS